MSGWGTFFGRCAEWFPGRKERYRSKIEAIKEEIDELDKKKATDSNVSRYSVLATQLQKYEKAIKNIS